MRINLLPEMNIEPGHQFILLPPTDEGKALVRVLTQRQEINEFYDITINAFKVPHNAEVDGQIVELIDWLSHVRFSAHSLIQLTFLEAPPPNISGQETTK